VERFSWGDKYLVNNNLSKAILSKMKIGNLKAECDNCFGLCCVALYFFASDGFPKDKAGGQPCPNLDEDFHCRVHKNLTELGLKGCRAYDCYGAGQKVSQDTFKGKNWVQSNELSLKMFDCYLIMRQLHELLWYLAQAVGQKAALSIKAELISKYEETEMITNNVPEAILQIDIEAHRKKVNLLLLQTSELVRRELFAQTKTLDIKNYIKGLGNDLPGKKLIGPGKDLIGTDLRKVDLRGANLRATYLIAADLRGCSLNGVDLIGADLRDADIRGADLSESIFLTQSQLNVAKGNRDTKLPKSLSRPAYWGL